MDSTARTPPDAFLDIYKTRNNGASIELEILVFVYQIKQASKLLKPAFSLSLSLSMIRLLASSSRFWMPGLTGRSPFSAPLSIHSHHIPLSSELQPAQVAHLIRPLAPHRTPYSPLSAPFSHSFAFAFQIVYGVSSFTSSFL
jgi:hypothetical protein